MKNAISILKDQLNYIQHEIEMSQASLNRLQTNIEEVTEKLKINLDLHDDILSTIQLLEKAENLEQNKTKKQKRN